MEQGCLLARQKYDERVKHGALWQGWLWPVLIPVWLWRAFSLPHRILIKKAPSKETP